MEIKFSTHHSWLLHLLRIFIKFYANIWQIDLDSSPKTTLEISNLQKELARNKNSSKVFWLQAFGRCVAAKCTNTRNCWHAVEWTDWELEPASSLQHVQHWISARPPLRRPKRLEDIVATQTGLHSVKFCILLWLTKSGLCNNHQKGQNLGCATIIKKVNRGTAIRIIRVLTPEVVRPKVQDSVQSGHCFFTIVWAGVGNFRFGENAKKITRNWSLFIRLTCPEGVSATISVCLQKHRAKTQVLSHQGDEFCYTAASLIGVCISS